MKGIIRIMRQCIVVLGILIVTYTPLFAQEKIEGLLYYDHSPVSIEISDGKITQVICLGELPEDFPEMYISPGFIDNQVNGFVGVSFSLGGSDLTEEGIEKATSELWKNGVTTYLPTLTTNSQKVLMKNFTILAKSLDDKILLGKRALIESVNNELKNTCQIEHTRHRSFGNFLTNMLSGLIAYSYMPKKPTLNMDEFVENNKICTFA